MPGSLEDTARGEEHCTQPQYYTPENPHIPVSWRCPALWQDTARGEEGCTLPQYYTPENPQIPALGQRLLGSQPMPVWKRAPALPRAPLPALTRTTQPPDVSWEGSPFPPPGRGSRPPRGHPWSRCPVSGTPDPAWSWGGGLTQTQRATQCGTAGKITHCRATSPRFYPVLPRTPRSSRAAAPLITPQNPATEPQSPRSALSRGIKPPCPGQGKGSAPTLLLR